MSRHVEVVHETDSNVLSAQGEDSSCDLMQQGEKGINQLLHSKACASVSHSNIWHGKG